MYIRMHSIYSMVYAMYVCTTYVLRMYVYAICIHICTYARECVCMYVRMLVSSVIVWLLLPLQDSTATVVAVTTKTTIHLSPQSSPPPVTLTHPASSQRKGNIQAQLTRSFSEDNILGTS